MRSWASCLRASKSRRFNGLSLKAVVLGHRHWSGARGHSLRSLARFPRRESLPVSDIEAQRSPWKSRAGLVHPLFYCKCFMWKVSLRPLFVSLGNLRFLSWESKHFGMPDLGAFPAIMVDAGHTAIGTCTKHFVMILWFLHFPFWNLQL